MNFVQKMITHDITTKILKKDNNKRNTPATGIELQLHAQPRESYTSLKDKCTFRGRVLKSVTILLTISILYNAYLAYENQSLRDMILLHDYFVNTKGK